MNYYNEFDPKAAAWLRELIKHGHIPPGIVDTRSIAEVKPYELTQYTQCHFFAGIGGWSYALQLAGWPADRPVWTGSCPCQPFSSAGKQLGNADARHLWPVFGHLITQCRPSIVFGEQVANAIGKGWLDGVCADLEAQGYACGAAVLGAHSVGAPHIRQRLFWAADSFGGLSSTERTRTDQRAIPQGNVQDSEWVANTTSEGGCGGVQMDQRGHSQSRRSSSVGGLDHALKSRLEGHAGHEHNGHQPGRVNPVAAGSVAAAGGDCGLADSAVGQPRNGELQRSGIDGLREEVRRCAGAAGDGKREEVSGLPNPGSDLGGCGQHEQERGQEGRASERRLDAWSRFDLIPCAYGKARRIEPGLAPLAYGVPGRVGLLRGYGNAIVPQTAAAFIQAVMD